MNSIASTQRRWNYCILESTPTPSVLLPLQQPHKMKIMHNRLYEYESNSKYSKQMDIITYLKAHQPPVLTFVSKNYVS